MKTAILCIATSPRYWEFARTMIVSAGMFFPQAEAVVWTDCNYWLGEKHTFSTPALGYPNQTLRRYHIFLEQKNFLLANYSQVFYVDADMRFVAPVGDIFSEGITATLHPGFFLKGKRGITRKPEPGQTLQPGLRYTHYVAGTPEERPESTAFLLNNEYYYCGGFNGGSTEAYLRMAETLAKNIDADSEKNIIALWHDESHLNRYLHDHPPAKTLSPSYCFPEGYKGHYGWSPSAYPPMLVATDKRGQR